MIKKLKYFQIDAFTNRLYSGNPAGVIFCPGQWPDNIQKIATEINQNETAFVRSLPASRPSGHTLESDPFRNDKKFDLRWLTPTCEVNLCGHATLAAAGALFDHGNVNSRLEFNSKSGILVAEKTETGITLDFPVDVPVLRYEDAKIIEPVIELCLGPNALKKVLHYEVGLKTKKLLVQLDQKNPENLDLLLNLPVPNGEALMKLHSGDLFKGICFTIIGTEKSSHDIISRYFAPWNGLYKVLKNENT